MDINNIIKYVKKCFKICELAQFKSNLKFMLYLEEKKDRVEKFSKIMQCIIVNEN